MNYSDGLLEDLIKEVYANFGLAYYLSECIHKELCHIQAISFQSASHITRPRIEENLSYTYSLTLGQVKDQLKDRLPQDLLSKLVFALEQRNFLAHRFWFERAHLMFSHEGLESMIAELESMAKLFSNLDLDLSEYARPKYEKLGLTEEILQQHLKEARDGKPMDPLLDKRKLKNQEKLIHAWEFILPNGTIPLIFETEDGCFWQLCDAGLGWTYHDKKGENWKLNEKIQPFLPAKIHPRPKDCQPWNYEFQLSKGAVLWIKPGKRPRTFIWGIRIKK
jgi:hypothetical protein